MKIIGNIWVYVQMDDGRFRARKVTKDLLRYLEKTFRRIIHQ
jgi:hypothetical protein